MNKKTMDAALKLVEKALWKSADTWLSLARTDKNGKPKPALVDYLYKNVGGSIGQNSEYVVCCCHGLPRAGSTKLVTEVMGRKVTYNVWLQERPKETKLPLTKERGPSSGHYGSGLTDGGHYDMVTHLNRIDNQRKVAISERGFRRWENQD